MPYTLLIPTHNRPALLRTQLSYLAKGLNDKALIVLDSSDEDTKTLNAETTETFNNTFHISFPPDTKPFAKFARGFEISDTEFSMLVPDDDFVWIPGIGALCEALDANPEAVAAHGLEFEYFVRGNRIHVTALTLKAPTIRGHRSEDRVMTLMSQYGALTYALYRTEVARETFSLAQQQQSILAQELLQGATTAARGQVLQLDKFSHGRRVSSSLGYSNWHPLEWLAIDPNDLFRSYVVYRDALLDYIRRAEGISDLAQVRRVVDLAHLAYLARHIDGEVLSGVSAYNPDRDGEKATVAAAWELWARAKGPQWARSIRRPSSLNRLLRSITRRMGLRNIYQDLSRITVSSDQIETIEKPGSSAQVYLGAEFINSLRARGIASEFLRQRTALARSLVDREWT